MQPIEEALLWRVVQAKRSMLVGVARAEGLLAEDAVDCVQDALTTFVRLVRESETREDFMPTLVTIVKNAARNRRKKHEVSKPHVESDSELAAIEAPNETADQLLAFAEDRLRLQGCVDGLCGIQKAVVTLRMLEEKPGEDVAVALGISPAHVAVLLHRAKAALQACMAAGEPHTPN